uniref:RRM domain-containing protein n=1 Tax=Lutzomyia longipalpis TaxID=7200 RepID=A0A1B0CHI0_LUTLO
MVRMESVGGSTNDHVFVVLISMIGHIGSHRIRTPLIHGLMDETRNVIKDYVVEIFNVYREIKNIEFPLERTNNTSRRFCYVEYNSLADVKNVMKLKDEGQIDGQETTAVHVIVPTQRLSLRRSSPIRNNRGGGPRWRKKFPDALLSSFPHTSEPPSSS